MKLKQTYKRFLQELCSSTGTVQFLQETPTGSKMESKKVVQVFKSMNKARL
jgi:hypothetical protein